MTLKSLLTVNEELLDSELRGLSLRRISKPFEFHFLIVVFASAIRAINLLKRFVSASYRVKDTFVIEVKLDRLKSSDHMQRQVTELDEKDARELNLEFRYRRH